MILLAHSSLHTLADYAWFANCVINTNCDLLQLSSVPECIYSSASERSFLTFTLNIEDWDHSANWTSGSNG